MRVKILQANSSGLAVSLKRKLFGLRMPQEEILEFYLRITLTFKWAYYQTRLCFCEIRMYFFAICCFNKHHLIYFAESDLGLIILK